MPPTLDNRITNSMVDAGKLPESQRENVPQPMPRVGDVRSRNGGTTTFFTSRNLPRVQPTVAAADLANPPTPATPPPPALATIPERVGSTVRNVARDVNGLITAQTEEARRAKELAGELSALNSGGSLADMMSEQRQTLGIDTNLAELKDIQLRLADMDTESALTKTRIEGAAGQTMAQAGREVTQEDRENAVRTAGLAARAAVLQGNINTATQLAKDTVDLAFKDRQLNAENILNQLNYYQGIADDQTAQLLEQDKRAYEAELAAIEELKTNIASAMVNGATQAEIAQLNDPALDDASKLALAQSITARGANEMRNLDIRAKQANIAQSYASAAASRTSQLLSLAEAGDPNAIDQLGFDPRSVDVELDPTTKRQLEEQVSSTSSLLNLASRYKKIIDDYGFTNQVFGDPQLLGEISTLRGLMTAEYKRAETLGTLDAGLITLMDSILGQEPTSSIIGLGAEGNALTNITGRKSERLSSQIGTFIDNLTNKRTESMLRLGINPTTLPPEDEEEIDMIMGGTNTTTPTQGGFNPATYFSQ